jgi:hypothetical protein
LKAEARGSTVELEGGEKESKQTSKVLPEGLETISHASINLKHKEVKHDTLRFVNDSERQSYFKMKANIAKNDRLS